MNKSDKSVFSIPVLRPVAGAIALFFAIGFFWPDICKELLGKEKWVEHLSDLILIVSVVLSIASLSIKTDKRFTIRVFFLILLLVLLLEETDYGGVYGFNFVENFFISHFHVQNFHNRITLPLVGQFNLYFIFSWVILLFFFLPFLGGHKLKEWYYPFCPKKNELAGITIIGFFRNFSFTLSTMGSYHFQSYYFQELYETLVYYILLAIALRGYKILTFSSRHIYL